MTRGRIADSRNDQGFTLIELLVVVIILGVLASIAIPTFLEQRQRAWRTQAQSDLRNAVIQLEDFALDGGDYSTADLTTFTTSTDVTVAFSRASSAAYCMVVTHSKLPGGPAFHFDSLDGVAAPGPCGP